MIDDSKETKSIFCTKRTKIRRKLTHFNNHTLIVCSLTEGLVMSHIRVRSQLSLVAPHMGLHYVICTGFHGSLPSRVPKAPLILTLLNSRMVMQGRPAKSCDIVTYRVRIMKPIQIIINLS